MDAFSQVESFMMTLYYYSEPAFVQCTRFLAIETSVLRSVGYNESLITVGQNELHTADAYLTLQPDVVDLSTGLSGLGPPWTKFRVRV